MAIFITGATGFIGTTLVKDLLAHGHEVVGLARSEEGAAALKAAGAAVRHGTIDDLDGLHQAAAASDGVVHLAFNHDFSRFAENCENDRKAVEALGSALVGSDRPFIVTSGTAITAHAPGEPSTEHMPPIESSAMPRAATEESVAALAKRGVNASIVRLPQVHDRRRQGLITYAIQIAIEKGVSAYIGDGGNRWPGGHVSDVARLYRLALERAEKGAIYHAVAEEGVPMRAIAETLGKRLGLPVASIAPEQAAEHFGWLAMFASHDLVSSGAWTQQHLGWTPTGPGLIEDLEQLELPA